MATIGSTPKVAYVYDSQTDTWVLIGTPDHTHSYIANTLVDAKGDIVTASANDTPAILSKGADGTVLVSDSTTSTGLAWQPYAAQSVAGKNLIINGAFDIWQRGTSTAHAASIFVADRWRGDQGAGGGDYTTSRQNVSTGEPFNYCARITRTTTTTTPSYFYTAIESLNSTTAKGNVLTLSFYARKGSGFSGVLVAHIYSGTGTDQGTPHGFTNLVDNSSNINLTTSFQKFTVTTSSALSSLTNQIGVTFNTVNQTGTPTNDYVEITGVQLELGSVATPFSRAGGSIQGELAACQRYYVRLGGDSSYGVIGTGIMGSTTEASFVVPLPVTMRVAPTSIDFSTLRVTDFIGVNTPISSMSLTTSETTKFSARLYSSGLSGLTQYRPAFISNYNSSSGYLGFSAEL